jgi:hypothetical protein
MNNHKIYKTFQSQSFMRDEKDLTKRIKNSFRAGKSRAEIVRGLQERGCKLEYADILINKAKIPKRVMVSTLIVAVLIVVSLSAGYALNLGAEKHSLQNPLTGNVVFSGKSPVEMNIAEQASGQLNEITLDQIEITPEFISYLLNEIGAWELHKNPLTFEEPIINFKIGDKTFYSKISDHIPKTFDGLSDKADIQFNTNKEDIIRATSSQSPKEIFRDSLANGRTEVVTLVGESELFAKGYLKLYEDLKDF